MIVKNEEANLRLTLPALAGAVDELIIVDTGSTDETVAIARQYATTVVHQAWNGDFARARNESLRHAQGDWIIWIDADEYIEKESWVKLKENIKDSQEVAYYLPIYECEPGQTQGETMYHRVKVFKNRQGLTFIRAINEQVQDTKGQVIIPRESMPEVKICHWGNKIDEQAKITKKKRNIALLEKAIRENPRDAYYHYLLANNYNELKEYPKALSEYQAALENSAGCGGLCSRIKNMMATILIDQNDLAQAEKLLLSVLLEEEDVAKALVQLGIIKLKNKMFDEAAIVLERAGREQIPQSTTEVISLDYYQYFPNYLLGLVWLVKGEKKKALNAYKTAYTYKQSAGLNEIIESLKKEVK